ncbi:MAG: alpha/beta hydrolase [Candidatus Staskawiczbacteria bacterium]|jgi:pimeloyl-ACP methyl ester carboxylesterase
MEITVNGLKTNYQTFPASPAGGGEGTPFLILHGWGSKIDRWSLVAEKIAEKGYKVIVPDLPGFGDSSALPGTWNNNNYMKWAEDFIKEINLTEFYLAGHSFGGALAVKLAIKHPQDVKKLFLIAAASVRPKTTQKKVLKNIAKIVNKFSFLPFYGLFRKAFYKFIIRKSDYMHVDNSMKETYKNVISEDLAQFTGFIRTPTIIIWGDKDNATPIEDAHFMSKKIKNAKLVIINGAGHALNKECPELLAEKIINNI